MTNSKIIVPIVVVLIGIVLVVFGMGRSREAVNLPADDGVNATTTPLTSGTSTPSANIPRLTVIAEELNIPWDIAFIPSEGMLVTERPGSIVHLKPDGSRSSIVVPRPKPKGEGGLLGMALHPGFSSNRYVYLYMTTEESDTGTKNAIFRYTFRDGSLGEERTIISGIPGALYHDGGRLEFGPDGYLYVTTGDAQTSAIAQDVQSLGGKILRLTDEGAPAPGNPFGTAVYSYGHRNSQGLAWDSNGNLWSSEHGRSGVTSGYDELNLIRSGGNYGWPTIEGPAIKKGMISPEVQSGTADTWAPASLAYLNGKLYFGGLRGEALFEIALTGDKAHGLKKHIHKEFGRIRTVRVGPDGMLYVTTSNRDGRGSAKPGDDKLIRINPDLL